MIFEPGNGTINIKITEILPIDTKTTEILSKYQQIKSLAQAGEKNRLQKKSNYNKLLLVFLHAKVADRET